METVSSVVERSKKHEGAHALVYHLLGREVRDWYINTYPGALPSAPIGILASEYAKPSYVSTILPDNEGDFPDRHILGGFAGLAAEGDLQRSRQQLEANPEWNDLASGLHDIQARLRASLGRYVLAGETRAIAVSVFKKLERVMQTPDFQYALEAVGDLLAEESNARPLDVSGDVPFREGENASASIQRLLSEEFHPSEIDAMKTQLQEIKVDRVVEAYARLRRVRNPFRAIIPSSWTNARRSS